MAQQNVLLKVAGLYSYPNRLSAIPNGALLRAKNIVINRDAIAESRRGFKIYGTQMGVTTGNSAHQLFDYKGRILRHWGSGSGQFLDVDSDGAGAFTTFSLSLSGDTHTSTLVDGFVTTAQLVVGMNVSGSNIPVNTTIVTIVDNNSIIISNAATSSITLSLTFTYDIQEVQQGLRIKSIEQNGNFYFTTSEGIKKISAFSNATLPSSLITQAGGVKALDVKASINNNLGFLSPYGVVGYRVVWGIKDANQNLILGTPSPRVIIKNTDVVNSKTVDLLISIPQTITTAHFYQVYRTAVFSNLNSVTFTGDTLITDVNITNIPDTSSLFVGMEITGTGIPAATTITAISSTTSIIISNAATATNTGVTFTSTQVLDIDPGDEQALVYENNPTNTDLNNGFVTVNDITPDSFRGANLYTNANSGEGIAQANDMPPLATDISTFKNYTFYSNTTTLQRLDLSLLSISQFVPNTSTITITDGTTSTTYTFSDQTLSCDTHSSTLVDNIADTSTLTAGASISGTDFTSGTYIVRIIDANSIEISQVAIATTVGTTLTSGYEDVANKLVGLSQYATPSQQVDETARSLIHVINGQASDIVYAYYLSGTSDIPGKMLLEGRSLQNSAFYLNVDDAATTGMAFSPNIPTSGNTVISANEVSPNRIYYSKVQQPEAVPILNYIDVGPKDKQIIRVLGLRDNLFVLKEEGIYRLSGSVAPFQVYPFDFSTQIEAADSAVVLNNLIYVFTNQGVATVSDTGVSIISRPIEDKIINLVIPQFTNFKTATFGLSYESDRAYYLFTVTNQTDTYATQCFRFNTFTNTWTLLDLSKRSGIVNSADDKVYLAPTDVSYLEQERKSFDRTDYADREIAITLTTDSVNENAVILPSLTNVSVGDVVTQVQTLTINQFNRLLTKLDLDSLLLGSPTYVSSCSIVPGEVFSDYLDVLIAKIRDDAGRQAVVGHTADASYTALIGTGLASFTALQTAFNNLIGLLNSDVGVGYKNYQTSTNTVTYEFVIDSIDKLTNTIYSTFSYPLVVGPITVYNHIATDIQFVPQYMTDVSITKHVSEGTFIFEDASFTQGTILYSSDLSANFESNVIIGNGNGIFGNNVFGQGLFGGNGSGIPFRTFVPRDKQRCRYINARFQHLIAREIFSLYGLSLTFNPTSQRGYR